MEDAYLTQHQPHAIPLRTPAGRSLCHHHESDVVLNMYQETSFCPNIVVLDPLKKNTFTSATRNRHKSYGAVSSSNSINNIYTASRRNQYKAHETNCDSDIDSSPLTIYKNTEFAVVPLLHAEDEIYDRLTSCFKVLSFFFVIYSVVFVTLLEFGFPIAIVLKTFKNLMYFSFHWNPWILTAFLLLKGFYVVVFFLMNQCWIHIT